MEEEPSKLKAKLKEVSHKETKPRSESNTKNTKSQKVRASKERKKNCDENKFENDHYTPPGKVRVCSPNKGQLARPQEPTLLGRTGATTLLDRRTPQHGTKIPCWDDAHNTVPRKPCCSQAPLGPKSQHPWDDQEP